MRMRVLAHGVRPCVPVRVGACVGGRAVGVCVCVCVWVAIVGSDRGLISRFGWPSSLATCYMPHTRNREAFYLVCVCVCFFTAFVSLLRLAAGAMGWSGADTGANCSRGRCNWTKDRVLFGRLTSIHHGALWSAGRPFSKTRLFIACRHAEAWNRAQALFVFFVVWAGGTNPYLYQ